MWQMIDLNHFKQGCQKAIEHLASNFKSLQLGRASTGLVENISVYIPSRGSSSAMNAVGNIVVVDAQTLKIEPWDKSTLKFMESAVHDAKIGLNPLNNGESLLIKIPPMTTERRTDMAKFVKKEWEEAKVSIRNLRQDMQKSVKQAHEAKELSDTDKGSLEKKIDETTKEFNTKIDDMVDVKSTEIMKI
jgi:ribosome recycling factor